VAGKSIGKGIGLRNNKQIVSFVAYVAMFFMRDKK
jgi:hypothetical protein